MHLAEPVINRNFLMMPNFLFTSVDCPDAECCQLVLTLARTLRSYLDSCHWFTVHQRSIRCSVPPLRLIPCPTLIFAPCQLVTAGRTPPALPESQRRLQMQRVTRWAPHPDGTNQPPPTPSPCLAICCLQTRCQSLFTPACTPPRPSDQLHS